MADELRGAGEVRGSPPPQGPDHPRPCRRGSEHAHESSWLAAVDSLVGLGPGLGGGGGGGGQGGLWRHVPAQGPQ